MDGADRLRPYVAGLAVDWLQRHPQARHRTVDGSLAFVDISGFTSLTERLAAKGKAGAEELTEILDATFAQLLDVAYSYGALLVKWGGDAVLLLFEGPDHERLACRAAHEMRALMRRIGRLSTSVGAVTLRMSVGVHSGEFDFFLVGRRHHELIVAGPAATMTAELEALADAGEIAISPRTAGALPARCVGAAKETGLLLRAAPPVDPRCRYWPNARTAFDFGSCLDQALRDHLATSTVDSEHRQIAVAFVEVGGVDAVLAAQGPGAVAGELHQVMSSVQDACVRHHVTFWETDISKDGFKILLVAGAPRSTGHDEEGLLRAARVILDDHTGRLRLRIGANCGRAFVGDFGPAFRRSFSVKADAVNLAARVMGKAGPGQLLATATILERSTTQFDVEPLEPFMVKGKSQPVQAAVVGRPEEHRATDAAAVPLVGRAEELRALRDRADAARAGHGGAVKVVGPAGAGKTRLVDELCAQLVDVEVARAYGDAYEASTAYFPFRRMLRGLVGVPPEATSDDVVGALRAWCAARASHLLPWLPLLATPFGLTVEDTPETAEVAPEFRPQRIAALVVDLLDGRLAGSAVIVVEDVYLADDASRELVARIGREAGHRRWLVVTTSRSLDGEEDGEAITLGPLSPDESLHLLRLRTAANPVPVRVARSAVERAGGNPLFLLELARALGGSSDEGHLPDSVEEVLAAQIDELAAADRSVLRSAAVLGVRFEDDLLAAVLDPPPTAATWAALERFLVDEPGRHRFRSKLLRDAAYEGLPFRRRQEMHGRLADEIARRAGVRVEDHAETLSLHYFEARRFSEAAHHAELAGRRARRIYANAEALTFYRRARDAARHVAEPERVDVASLSESVGDVCAALTELDAAVESYRDARRHVPASAWLVRGRLALGIARADDVAGATRSAARWLATAARELRQVTGADSSAAAGLLGWVYVERAVLAHLAGRRGTAQRRCAQAVAIAEPVGADEVVARALQLEDMIDLAGGGTGDEQRARRALALFERCGDLPRQTGMWNHLGAMSYFAGRWDVAVEHYERSRALAQRCGDDWAMAIAAANIGEIRLDQGRMAEAEPVIREAAAVLRASGTPTNVGFVASLLGRLCGRSGRFDEAMVAFQEALDAYAAKDERLEIADTRLRIAEACILRGDAAGALQWEAAARDLLVEVLGPEVAGDRDGTPPVGAVQTSALLRVRGQALVMLGRPADAQPLFERSLGSARARAAWHDVALTLRALVSVRGDQDAEDEAARLFAQLGVRWTPPIPAVGAAGVSVAAAASTPQQRRAPVSESLATPSGS